MFKSFMSSILRSMAKIGSLSGVRCAVKMGGDLRAYKDYALRLAAKHGHLDIVKYCVEQGCDIRVCNDEALIYAAIHGHLDIVKYCVEQGCDIRTNNNAALRFGAGGQNVGIVEYLFEHGADFSALSDIQQTRYLSIYERCRTEKRVEKQYNKPIEEHDRPIEPYRPIEEPYRLINDHTVLKSEGRISEIGELHQIFDFAAKTVTQIVDKNPAKPLRFAEFLDNRNEITAAYDWLKAQGKTAPDPFTPAPRKISRRQDKENLG